MVIIECHERCAQEEWFAASNRRERGKWMLGLFFVASLCLNQWSVSGIGAGGATLSRSLGLGLRACAQEEIEENTLSEEEHLQLQSRRERSEPESPEKLFV